MQFKSPSLNSTQPGVDKWWPASSDLISPLERCLKAAWPSPLKRVITVSKLCKQDLTFGGHWKSSLTKPLKHSDWTSYKWYVATISLSCTGYSCLKAVRPGLTCQCHGRANLTSPISSSAMVSYRWTVVTICLACMIFPTAVASKR